MRVTPSIAIVLLLASLAGEAGAAPPAPKHSIVGNWTFEMPNTKCSETYAFRPDGTATATSGEEKAETKYEISAAPSAKGFYKLSQTIAKDNGKKDCSGQITELGTKSTNYIRFDPSGEAFVVCQSESIDSCVGPVIRVPAKKS